MTQYLIGVDFQPGDDEAPMSDWTPEEVQAHLDYYGELLGELEANGELVSSTILTGPDLAKIVRSDGAAPVVTDGPFQEFKEWLAGFQVVEVDSEERALEIASRMSAVPGRGGVPTRQPIHVRQVMEQTPSNPEEMDAFLRTAGSTP
ncbi:YciI family protein [Terrabacter carboxydivorans]|uniref:YciI family protein n=1 Tax=Terrabacter carboxydivorans TaxID=619730 RepID=A0ABP5ZCR2_9MICO